MSNLALKRVLTLPTVVSTSAGLTFATSCFLAAVQVASYLAGDAAWLAILVSGSLCLMAGLCFSELNGILPSAAGLRLYFAKAYNNSFALTISIFYMLTITAVVGTESYVLSRVLEQAIPKIPAFLWIIVMFSTVAIINIRGVKMAGRFQDIVTYGLICSLIIIAIIGLSKGSPGGAPQLFAVGSVEGMINAVAIGVFLFIGFEWVTPLAEEVTDIKLIPSGMLIALGILSITYGLFTVAMTRTVPRELLVNSPVPQVVFLQHLLGWGGLVWIVILSMSASITTFNAGLISVSRFFYATAREHAIPAVFGRLSLRYFTPYVAILAIAGLGLAVSAVVFTTGNYLTMVNVGAAIESLVYALAGLATYLLRRKMPDVKRPFLVKGGPLIPLATLVIFALLTVAVLSQDLWAAVFLIVGLTISGAYVHWVVPRLKAKQQAARRTRPRIQE